MKLPRVIIQHERHAIEVLVGLIELVNTYGEARISDYRELLAGSNSVAVPEYYEYWHGWQELNDVKIVWADGGFVILLPEPINLDDRRDIHESNNNQD